MLVLGIETSCDESAAAVVEDGHRIVSNVVATQAEVHARYGGVVPEVASRQHLQTIVPVIETALEQAGASWRDLGGIAVTHGPGLAGSLLVGVNAAKGLAYAQQRPLIGVNHLEGHVYANWLDDPSGRPPPSLPALCLVVSGGHTDLIVMEAHGVYRRIGRTKDDAAGEAFDKVSRLIGLGYPGGPAIELAAKGVSSGDVRLPRAWLRGTYDFSFSGVKTAVLHLMRADRPPGVHVVAAAFQEAVIDVLAEKTAEAARDLDVGEVMLSGGVAANSALRERVAQRSSVPVRAPLPCYCTDNAAMIAACGYFHLSRGEHSGWDLDVEPNLKFAT
jgi:N6-L-threonylcarbamoyladenine synthase